MIVSGHTTLLELLFNPVISVVSAAADAVGIYGFVSTVTSGDTNKPVLDKLEAMDATLERLSDNILYAPNFEGLIDTTKVLQNPVRDLREARELLEPLQQEAGVEIFSSALIGTPHKMKNALMVDPWKVLLDPRPAHLAMKPNDPDLIPILFEHDGVRYIGWQKSGTLPMMFNCEFHDLPGVGTALHKQGSIHSKPKARTPSREIGTPPETASLQETTPQRHSVEENGPIESRRSRVKGSEIARSSQVAKPTYTPLELMKIQEACTIARDGLSVLEQLIRPGVSTEYLDDVYYRFCTDRGGSPAILNLRGYPKSITVSVNHGVTNGLPSDKPLADGDVVGICVSCAYEGLFGRKTATFEVGSISKGNARLISIGKEALSRAIGVVRDGVTTGDIGHSIQTFVERNELSVVREFCGSAIGRELHSLPNILNYGIPSEGRTLREGEIVTIHPMLVLGVPSIKVLPDGWTVVTRNKNIAAEFADVVLITSDGSKVLTK